MTRHIRIRGKVQGVFFRASAKEKADSMGIVGWVKNNLNGDVEIMASGPDAAIDLFLNWCQRGPSGAVVNHVFSESGEDMAFNHFSILK